MFKSSDDYSGAGAFRLEDPCPYLTRSGTFMDKCYEWCRPTVAMLGIHNGRVLLVRSSKRTDENDQPGWLFPQGGVEAGRYVLTELAREMREELALKYSLARLNELDRSGDIAVLGGYMNTCRGGKKPKYIVTVAVPIVKPSRIVLSSEENDDYRLVGTPQELSDLLVTTRPVKRLGIYSAVSRAYVLGLIDWSCDGLFGELRQTNGLTQVA